MVFASPTYLPTGCSLASGSMDLVLSLFEAVHFFPSSSIREVILLGKFSLSPELSSKINDLLLESNLPCCGLVAVVRSKCHKDQCTKEKKYLEGMGNS